MMQQQEYMQQQQQFMQNRMMNMPPQQEYFNNYMQQQQPQMNQQMNNNNNNNYSPEGFLEDPLSLVKRNINIRGWSIKEGDRVIGKATSIELLIFLEKRLKEQLTLNGLWIYDMLSDIYYTPNTLYEVLKENAGSLMHMNNPYTKRNPDGYSNNNNNNNNRNEFQQPNPYMNMPQNNYQHPPVNVNLNVNLIPGDVGLNSVYLSPQQNPYYQNNNDNTYYQQNLNNIYNNMKSNPNMVRNMKK